MMNDVKTPENAVPIIERYAEAYVAGSVVVAAKSAGLLELLGSRKQVARPELPGGDQKPGYLDPFLEVLRTTGHIRSMGEHYIVGGDSDCPKQALKLYWSGPIGWVRKPKLQRAMAAWLTPADDEPVWLSFATRFCVLLGLATGHPSSAPAEWEKPLRRAFAGVCGREGWAVAKGRGFSFTPLGRGILEAARMYAPFIEVGPELARLDRVLKGEVRNTGAWFVPASEAFEAEVLGYFGDADQESPRHILHVDGDGAALARLYRLIEKSMPDASPELLALCSDEASAYAAREHLKMFSHRVLMMNDGEDPAALLAANGVDPGNVLFTGSPSARWVRILDGHPFGLTTLQGHGLAAGWNGTQTPAWSIVQTLMGGRNAETALMSAANTGLFPRRQPRTFSEGSACHASVTNFVGRPYRMRYARIEDLEALDRLEELCWHASIRTPRGGLEARLRDHPRDHVVLTLEDEVIGVVYSQRLPHVDALQGACAADAAERRCASGPVVQLLALEMDPAYQSRGWGDELLEFMLQRCALLPGVHTVVGVTRCQRFDRQELPIKTYIHARTEEGRLVDPVLRLHELHGAQILKPMPAYRPGDRPNQGYGVLVHYDLATRQRRDSETRPEHAKADPDVYSNPASRLERMVRNLLLEEAAFAWDRPLMEMGLNSADLLLLGESVASAFGVSVDPVFFFTHNTCEKLLAALNPAENGRRGPARREDHAEGIAVIGLSCRLPGSVTTPDELWQVLAEGRDVVGTLPAGRWEWLDGVDPDKGNPGIDCGGFLDNIARFDAGIFRISPREAKLMDPQQRILLEQSWSALEDAGYSKDAVAGTNTGVFVGASGSDYRLLLERYRVPVDAVMGTGTAAAALPNRISYFFDLQGPSLLIDTACSSSLVAVHEAMQALRAGACEQALAGGIHIMCHPAATTAYYAAGMLSPDGRCKTFDAEANGYVRSEGAVVMMLKPLSAARRAGDRIYAVLKGSACNHGGQAGGFTVPNPDRQTALLRAAWEAAGVSADQLGCLEAHGTGTALGDPIEVKGIRDAFRADCKASASICYLGSLKSNLGHLEAVAGVAGLMKLALCLHHRQLVPSLHIQDVNPKLGLEQTPFRIARQTIAWPRLRSGQLSLAGVSSFGSGGTNAHVVLEGVEETGPARAEARVVIRLFAANAERLVAYARRLRDHLHSLPAGARPSLSAVAYTLSRRQRMEVSASYWAEDEASLFAGLDDVAGGRATTVDEERKSFGEGPVISLPGYPFAETLFWFDKPQFQSAAARPAKVILEDPVKVARRSFGAAGEVPESPRADGPRLNFADEGDGLWVVTIGRSKANGARVLAELEAGMASLGKDPKAKVAVFPDLGSFPDVDGTASNGVVKLMKASPLILVGAVKHKAGHAGKRLAEAADLTVCEEKAARALGRQLAVAPRLSLSLLKAQLRQQAASGLAPEISWAASLPEKGCNSSAPYRGKRVSLRTEVVTVEADDDGIIWVTLCDRASKNSFSPAFLDGVCEAFDHIRASDAYKVVVLTGFGRYFCSGGTKEGLLSIQRGQTRFTDLKVFSLPLECELPVIAAMQGHAIGAGWSTGLFCDLPVMAEECVYEAPYMRYGFTPGAGSTLVFPARFGFALASEILLAGQAYSGADLRGRGIPFPVLPAGEVETYALQVARQWAKKSREELIEEKAARCASLRDRLAETLAQELAMHEASFVGQDGVAAAIESSFVEPSDSEQVTVLEPSVSPSDAVSSKLHSILCETLAHELHVDVGDVDMDRPFLEMGLDSVIGVTWARKLKERFGLPIAVSRIYAHPTVRAMGSFLLSENSVRLALADASEPTRAGQAAPVSELKNSRGPAIAVIGMSGRFPKANNVDACWRNLLEGRDCISEVPSDRWPVDAYFDPTPQVPGKTYSRWMGVLQDADKFDPLFFSISPSEAAAMDPQQRVFLEACWGCIEDAGYAPSSLSGTRCGVFAGCGTSDYNQHLEADELDAQRFIGGSLSILPARISYYLNLRGPSLTIDTACSASLVAIAIACDNLMAGACDTSLAGGVCVMAGPAMHIMTSQARMLSPDGRCFTFDQRANGFVPGEGVGVVLLKRLADAERDGDRILGVLRGWGVNQDGKTNGITAPNGDAQANLLRDVYERYGIDAATIQLVEAHGTGTKLGDPIEVEGLCQAFSGSKGHVGSCALGSVKSNIGHLLMAAGVAGLIKTLLALRERTLPPNIHFEQLNEHLALDGSPFYVNDRPRPWTSQGTTPRRAAVNSFGFSGTNAHVVVEEYPVNGGRGRPQLKGPFLAALSAREEDRLREAAQRLRDHMAAHPEEAIADIAYTLQVGRDAMAERVGFLVASREDLVQQLGDFLDGRASGWMQATVKKEEQPVFHATCASGEALRAWVGGAHIDWSRLYPAEARLKRLSLPTYPFARQRYWACAALPGGSQVDGDLGPDWLLQPLPTDVDWRARFLNSARGLQLVLHHNAADAGTFVDLLRQIADTAGLQESVHVRSIAVVDGQNVSFEEEPAAIFILGNVTPRLPARRPRVYQLLDRPAHDHDCSLDSWVCVVCGETAAGVAPLQRLFQEWLADESVGKAARQVRYIGQQRFVRRPSQAPADPARPWLIEKKWVYSELPVQGVPVEWSDVAVLANEESAALAKLLFPRLSPCNLLRVGLLGRDAEACKAAGARCRAAVLIDLSDLYAEPRGRDADPSQKAAFYQGLIGQGAPLNLLYATRALQAFRALKMSLAGAKFAGLVKMLSAEYSHVQARCLDLDGIECGSVEKLRKTILGELQSELRETEICYRGGERFVPRLEALVNEEAYRQNRPPVGDQGVYVVTGGTRGIGLEVASELVQLGARKLVVMGRQSLPPQEQWGACLADALVEPGLRDKLAGLQALRQSVDVLEVYTGALTDGDALREFFEKVRASHGELRGVVHAAGVYSNLRTPAFVQKDPGDMQRVWEPKVDGLERLTEVFAEDDLDFFISFSSLTGLIPSLARGSADYAMANAFMDFASAFQFHGKSRKAWRTVTWVDWRNAGVTARSPRANVERLEKNLAEVGLSTFDNQQGRDLFREALSGPARPWVLLAYINEETFRAAQPSLLHGRKSLAESSAPEMRLAAVHDRLGALDERLAAWEAQKQRGVRCPVETLTSYVPLEEIRGLEDERIDRIYRLLRDEPEHEPGARDQEVADVESGGDLAAIVRATFSGLLKLTAVDDREAFQNYGLDSISAAIFSNRLEKALGRPVQPDWLIEYPTVSALAEQLEAVLV